MQSELEVRVAAVVEGRQSVGRDQSSRQEVLADELAGRTEKWVLDRRTADRERVPVLVVLEDEDCEDRTERRMVAVDGSEEEERRRGAYEDRGGKVERIADAEEGRPVVEDRAVDER